MRSHVLLGLLGWGLSAAAQSPLPSLIPIPMEMRATEGNCNLLCIWNIQGGPEVDTAFTGLLRSELTPLHAQVQATCPSALSIDLHLIRPDTLLPKEWYTLEVAPERITVEATTEEGLFRGSRTLVQLLEQARSSGTLPCLVIVDQPRFGYRGMHLDVVRHFFPVDFLKRYIDLLARYKMNTFHWHLTDDQGWRIEIKQYPKLSEISAWRSGSQYGPYSRREYDDVRYGGFYTQEEIREVVAYAQRRHINVIPEIEMPGHALAALAAYPELGCTGGPYAVEKGWGVFEDVFCPKEETFTFLQNVLTEVIDLFPSPYIHIGGDECPKERWKTCPHCQALMKREGLKDEHALQSYFVQRMERFVNSKGRKIIGWDEILEGGLAPNATVMSWTGIEGGIAAAKSGHDAIMTPGSHCYFDHYQGDPANEPLAIGGYTPLQKVYAYEPIPAALTAEQGKHILGAQANLWAEYILTTDHVEYMVLPRMLALSEVVWSPKAKRNEADFLRRLPDELAQLKVKGFRYASSLYAVEITPKQGPRPGTIAVEMSCGMPGTIERSCQCIFKPTSDQPSGEGSPMTGEERCNQEAVAKGLPCTARVQPYDAPILLDSDTRVSASLRRENASRSDRTTRTFRFNKATARPMKLSAAPHERYSDGGAFTLVNGISAQEKRVNHEWLGWRQDVTVTVDLGTVQDISYAGIGALHEVHAWIHAPERIVISISTDGKTYTPLKTVARPADAKGRTLFAVEQATKARYVRFVAKSVSKIPAGNAGAGGAAWLFLDEVEVR